VSPRLVLAAGVLAGAVACRSQQHPYSDALVESFMRGCQQRAGEPACRCALDRIRERYTAEEYEALEASIRAGAKPPEEFSKVATACGG
jgi:hypothetical protein